MEFTVIASPRAAHQSQHQAAIIKGLSAHGITAKATSARQSDTKHVACWGWRIGKEMRAKGHEVLVIERGYLGDRFSWTSLGWNGLNGRATFPAAPQDHCSRFAEHFEMKPWKDGGDYVLIMGQVPGDASLQGKDMLPWYSSAAAEAYQKYGMPVKFRPHPLALKKGHRQQPRGAEISVGPLDDALRGAAVVITYNSNSGVDSVLAGVPTLSFDCGSMAYDVTGHLIGELIKPDRERWASDLAWKQWQLSEIESGEALTGLLDVENG